MWEFNSVGDSSNDFRSMSLAKKESRPRYASLHFSLCGFGCRNEIERINVVFSKNTFYIIEGDCHMI